MLAESRRVCGAAFKAKVALAAAKGSRTTAQMASQFAVNTSPVTAWKKHLMAQVGVPFAEGRQGRPDKTTDEEELHEGAPPYTVTPTFHQLGFTSAQNFSTGGFSNNVAMTYGVIPRC